MKLSTLAAAPQLVQLTLDDEETIKEYGEPLEFYTWDRQPLDVFMRMAVAQQQDSGQMLDLVRTLILDEAGQPVITDTAMVPAGILVKAIGRITDFLGK